MGFPQKKHLPITSTPVHITYRLSGSIPKATLEKLETKKLEALQQLDVSGEEPLTLQAIRAANKQRDDIIARHELALDAVLDKIKTGPFHLQDERIREVVLKSWKNLHDRGIAYLIAVCVMGNHVHVIVKAPEDLNSVTIAPIMKSHIGFTARKANQILDRMGVSFWDGSYYDRKVRSGKFTTAMWYVLNNPVKAGWVDTWSEWPGTYVNEEYVELFLRPTG